MSLFDALRLTGRRQPTREEEDQEIVSLAQARAAEFGPWASGPQGELFLMYLDNLIGFAEDEEAEHIESHAMLAFARGKREALGALRAEFNKWRGSVA